MAIDATTLGPIVPYSEAGNAQTMTPIYMHAADTSTTYNQGDCVVVSSGKASVANVDPTPANVIGIVAQPYTTGATVGDNDLIAIWPAYPGAIFEGSIVDNTGDLDITTTIGTHTFDAISLDNGNAGVSFAVLDYGNLTNKNVSVIGVSVAQRRGVNFEDGVTVNGRVLFQFVDSVFITPQG